MKYNFSFLFLLLQLVYTDQAVSSVAPNLVASNKLYTDANGTLLIDSYSTYENTELLNKCAVDLCGPPALLEKNVVLDKSFDEYSSLSTIDVSKEMESVESLIKTTFDSIQQNNQTFIEALKHSLNSGNFELPQLSEEDRYRLFQRYFFEIFRNSSKEEKEQFLIEIIKSSDQYNAYEPSDIKNPNQFVFNYIQGYSHNRAMSYEPTTINMECNDLCLKITDRILSPDNIASLIKDTDSANNDELAKANAMDQCIGKFRASYKTMSATKHFHVNTNETYLSQFVEDTKNRYLRNVFGDHSDETKALLSSFIDKDIQVVFPPGFPTLFKQDISDLDIASYFLERIERMKEQSIVNIDNYDRDTFSILSRTFNLYFYSLRGGDNVELWKDVGDKCNFNASFVPKDFSYFDHFDVSHQMNAKRRLFNESLKEGPYIVVSIFSRMREMFGKLVFAHELTHAFSAILGLRPETPRALKEYYTTLDTKNNGLKIEIGREAYDKIYDKFSDVKQCASNFHTKQVAKGYLHDELTILEEDMADIFAFMAFKDDPNLRICNALSTSIDNTSYLYLSMMLNRSNPERITSPPLLRLIREAQHKRVEMPASCQEVMELYEDDWNFNLCT